MHKGKYVFSRLLDFLDRNGFNYLARKYDGDKYVKHLTCYNQLAVLMFGQLSNRESMRDVVLATQAHAAKAFHLGFGRHISKSTLADANSKRDYRIFETCSLYLTAILSMNLMVLPHQRYFELLNFINPSGFLPDTNEIDNKNQESALIE